MGLRKAGTWRSWKSQGLAAERWRIGMRTGQRGWRANIQRKDKVWRKLTVPRLEVIYDIPDELSPVVGSCGGRPPLLDEIERMGLYHGRFRVL
jgi:hypothetical protein